MDSSIARKLWREWISIGIACAICMVALSCKPSRYAQADTTRKADAELVEVRKVVYMIHPLCYERFEKNHPEQMRELNYQIYRNREKHCEKLWKQAIGRFESDVIYVQLASGYVDPGDKRSIFEYAEEELGQHRVIALGAVGSGIKESATCDLEHYSTWLPSVHNHLAESLLKQLREKGFKMDPAKVEWELWGESFEGCVHGYGSGMATSLRLEKAPIINFEMTVPDARFLCEARFIESFPVDGTDVRAYVFDGIEGFAVAIFLPGFRIESDDPVRYVVLELDSSKVSVVNKCGTTLFCRGQNRKPSRDYKGIIAADKYLQIRLKAHPWPIEAHLTNTWYIFSHSLGRNEFLAVLRNAKIVTEDETKQARNK